MVDQWSAWEWEHQLIMSHEHESYDSRMTRQDLYLFGGLLAFWMMVFLVVAWAS